MPPPFAAQLNALLARHRDELVEALYGAIERQNEQKALEGRQIVDMSRDEMSQSVHGLRAVLAETLAGATDELRRNDYETLFPGLRDAGVRLTDMVGTLPLLYCHVVRIATAHLPPDLRDDDAHWVGEYAFRHATDIVRVWVPD
ncbi:MAG TPA: hypothetical protein VFS43_41155 [Polyangiaceae bacterium]|nr:hypothetical protein [Polyangiaceae bacterium]